ncbi:NAD-dependent epimerase/dehydratase family protein [Devosia sp. A449]
MASHEKPLVLITGAGGRIGGKLFAHLSADYTVVGLDLEPEGSQARIYRCDLTSDKSVKAALAQLRGEYGAAIAAVVHLAAYFDFSGEDNPLYKTVNVDGTRRLIRNLKPFTVERLIYTSTMLVHAPSKPGELTTEATPLEPTWAYPKSKLAAEHVIAREAGDMPYTLLRLAGVYDEKTLVPTLAQQIARIYERDFESGLYAGDPDAGQSFLHVEDMADAVKAAIDRRTDLPDAGAILVGEPGALSYDTLQHRFGELIHGEADWTTITMPRPVAKVGARLQGALEPAVPDSLDQGERPFIRPFMIDLADDHYALDIAQAHTLLGWDPKHRLERALEEIVANLKADPMAFYAANRLAPPPWMSEAADSRAEPETIRAGHEAMFKRAHFSWLWAHFANIFLGVWLLTSPTLLNYNEPAMMWSDWVAGALLIVFGALSLNWTLPLARFGAGIVGLWVLFAPLLFWTPSAAAYLNGTAIGALVIGFAVVSRPFPLISPLATQTGPDVPPGWNVSPSTFLQRAPIIALALVGFFVSRYLTAYQLGHVDGVWDPFFPGVANPQLNGTEDIITSELSKAWPVPDAGIGAATYMLEILTGLIGSSRRWRTIPWLVFIFGLMIVPLGVVSVTFIIIQPILLSTWCALCLIAAAAMVIQIPYSLDELVATGQFLMRKKQQGVFIRAFLFGDTDEGDRQHKDDFDRPPRKLLAELGGGVGLPWTLGVAMLIGILLMTTRLTLGSTGAMANADHLIGALVVVVAVTAMAEVARAVRLLNLAMGAAIVIMPFLLGASLLQTIAALVMGVLLMACSLPKGRIGGSYGGWNKYIV